jgi:DNA-binding PadR family transcriptional regulator
LRRLEKEKVDSAAWKLSENNQRMLSEKKHIKAYRLTTAGRKQLSAECTQWTQLLEAIRQYSIQRARRARNEFQVLEK